MKAKSSSCLQCYLLKLYCRNNNFSDVFILISAPSKREAHGICQLPLWSDVMTVTDSWHEFQCVKSSDTTFYIFQSPNKCQLTMNQWASLVKGQLHRSWVKLSLEKGESEWWCEVVNFLKKWKILWFKERFLYQKLIKQLGKNVLVWHITMKYFIVQASPVLAYLTFLTINHIHNDEMYVWNFMINQSLSFC